jgi:TonB family protein
MRAVALLTIAVILPGCSLQRPAHAQASEVRRSVLLHRQPAYPELARRMHLSGDVTLRIDVLPDGSVAEARAESGHALLRQAAESAVLSWRFAPAGGVTVTTVTVSFHADGE